VITFSVDESGFGGGNARVAALTSDAGGWSDVRP
jgi:hypothetical protein